MDRVLFPVGVYSAIFLLVLVSSSGEAWHLQEELEHGEGRTQGAWHCVWKVAQL